MSRTRHHGYKQKDRIGRNDHWCCNEPKWWRRYFKHKKRRAENARLIHRVERGDYEQVWPLDTKPWFYYW